MLTLIIGAVILSAALSVLNYFKWAITDQPRATTLKHLINQLLLLWFLYFIIVMTIVWILFKLDYSLL